MAFERIVGPRRLRVLALLMLGLALGSCSGSSSTSTAALDATNGSGDIGSSSSTTVAADPITGYGDFSGVRYFDLDREAVVAAQIACMNDLGWAFERDGPTAMKVPDVPTEQQPSMRADFDACTEGLHIPAPEPPTAAEIDQIFDHLLATKACLESLGYSIEEPPTRETFAEQYASGPWHPYLSLPLLPPDEFAAVEQECPQS